MRACRSICGMIAVCLIAAPGLAVEPGVPTTAGGLLVKSVKSVATARSLARESKFLGFDLSAERIQIAFVIDGTDSMTVELAALHATLQEFADNLQELYVDSGDMQLELAVVVYRDINPEVTQDLAKAYTIPSRDFQNISEFEETFAELDAESGAPYYQERVDAGLNAAIEQLNWADPASESAVSRWIVLCGDAPPYPDGVAERTFTSAQLVEKARARQIHIYSIQCSSGYIEEAKKQAALNDPKVIAENQDLLKVAEELRPETATFMQQVAEGTGGRFVTMFDEKEVRAAMDPTFQLKREIAPILDTDVAEFVENSPQKFDGTRVRVLVLPHTSLNAVESTWFDNPGAASVPLEDPTTPLLVGTEIKRILPSFGNGGFDFVPQTVVREQLESLPASLKTDRERIAYLSKRTGAKYAVWGEYTQPDGDVKLTSGVYRGTDGKQIVVSEQITEASFDAGVRDIAQTVVQELSRLMADQGRQGFSDAALVAAFSARPKPKELPHEAFTPIAEDIRVQRAILGGLDLVEQALEYLKPSANPDEVERRKSEELLLTAITRLTHAQKLDPKHPLTSVLLSSCYFNLADDSSSDMLQLHRQHLEDAYANRNHPFYEDGGPAVKELEAHYKLLIQKDVESAVALFTELTSTPRTFRGHFALRAHWMLAGLYLGDWGVKSVAPELLSAEKSREHILNVLARWKDSSEAQFYRKALAAQSDPSNPQPSVSVPLTSNPSSLH